MQLTAISTHWYKNMGAIISATSYNLDNYAFQWSVLPTGGSTNSPALNDLWRFPVVGKTGSVVCAIGSMCCTNISLKSQSGQRNVHRTLSNIANMFYSVILIYKMA